MKCSVCGKEFGSGASCQYCGTDRVTALGTYSGYAVPSAARSQKNPVKSSPHSEPDVQEYVPKPGTMGVCPFCNEVIPAGVKFCPSCGKALKMTCPQCGEKVEPTFKFCPNCGHSLLGGESLSKQKPELDLLNNPVLFKITIGETTVDEARSIGLAYDPNFKVDKNKHYNGIFHVGFWDHDGDGIVDYIYYIRYNCDFPDEWKAIGFDWDNSYSEWRQLFISHKFSIHDDQLPRIESAKGIGSYFSAAFTASSPKSSASYELNFSFERNSRTKTDKKTLYSIIIRKK